MTLEIEADWLSLERGSPEERACFAALGIRHNDTWLTQAEDAFARETRSKVFLSAYHLAEFLAWNWWRLRWEPRARTIDWGMAHRLATIGGGYVWPNVTIWSDGERVVLSAQPTGPRPAEPLRYIADTAVVVRARQFEAAVDGFAAQVLSRLEAHALAETNFQHLWQDLQAERADPEVALRRRLEALLGRDPDAGQDDDIADLVAGMGDFGVSAVGELAADHHVMSMLSSVQDLRAIAASSGVDARPVDAVRVPGGLHLPPVGEAPAWYRGAEAARRLRQSEALGSDPISNQRLADLAGVPTAILGGRAEPGPMSFALDKSAQAGRVVLRSRWTTGRRFDLARLLGDRLAGGAEDALTPVTRAYTYRQKMQRSFAAELLCPFDALDAMLDGDFSSEAIEDAAAYYGVSERAVRTLLVNHRRLDRHDLDGLDLAV